MKKRVLFFVICFEVIVILFLSFYVYSKRQNTVSINWLNRSGLIFQKNSSLEYFYEPKPKSIISLNLHKLGQEYNYSVKYSYNSDTLRRKGEIPKEKHETYRILAVGDSFTFGSNLNDNQTYPAVLEYILNQNLPCGDIKKFEVLNLGVPGYDIRYTIERFKKRGQKYNSDLVLWFMIPDDLLRINELIVGKTLDYEEQMRENGKLQKNVKNKKFFSDYIRARDEVISKLGEKKVLNIQEKYLLDFKNNYKNKLVIFTFFGMPKERKNVIYNIQRSNPNVLFYENLIDIYAEKANFPDNHPNVLGAKLIANDIKKYLVKNKIIDCKGQ